MDGKVNPLVPPTSFHESGQVRVCDAGTRQCWTESAPCLSTLTVTTVAVFAVVVVAGVVGVHPLAETTANANKTVVFAMFAMGG